MIDIANGIVKVEGLLPDPLSFLERIKELDHLMSKSTAKHDDERDTDVLVNIPIEVLESFQPLLLSKVTEYASMYGTVWEDKSKTTLLKYGNGQKYNNHVDDHPRLPRRRISSVFYINDNYEGGEIEFPRFNTKIKPKENTLLLFPSSYTYNHIVHTITSGYRYCFVQWFS